MAVFLDTGFLVALHNAQDEHREKAVAIAKRIANGDYGQAVTSDYIVDEGTTLVFARTKNRNLSVVFLKESLQSGEFFTIEKVTPEDFKAAVQEYLRYDRFSFTDCSILALMARKRIRYLATFDSEFAKVDGIRTILE